MTAAAGPLADALTALAAEPASPDLQRAVHEALLDADVLVPRDEDGRVLIDRGTPGRGPSLVVFSGPRPAQAWGLAADAVRAPARELLAYAASQGIEQVALDPSGPVAVVLGSWEMRRLAAGQLPTPGGEERLAIAPLRAPLPSAAVEALGSAAAPLGGLDAVSVYEADPLRGRRHLLVGLHLAGDTPLEPVVDALHAALEPVAPDGALVNFAVVAPDRPPFAALEPAAVVWRRG